MDKLSSPKKTAEIVNRHGFKFSKSLGQNFLIDDNIIEKIIRGADILPGDNILEIGPGIGTLTMEMANKAKKVVAIEIDSSLVPIIEENMKGFENFSLLNEDFMKTDVSEVVEKYFNGEKFKVVANLPYYITTPIIMRFLEENHPVSDIIVMVQKEVALRMNASPSTKDYGALSVAVQYYCDTEIISKVPRHMFMPQPKVDSIVIALRVRQEKKYEVEDEGLFFETVRASFGKRRKTLLNSLQSVDGATKDIVESALNSSNIDSKRRGETLSIEEFSRLSNELSKLLDR